MREFMSHSEADTIQLARALAASIDQPAALALTGPLGSGKTCFARAFIRAKTHALEEVPSPTFTLVNYYDAQPFPVHHYDLYRLEHVHQLEEIGFTDSLEQAICLIEWPSLAAPLLEESTLHIRFTLAEETGTRHITMEGSCSSLDGLINDIEWP